ncbi:MAG TPA: hypothetical protein VMT76_06340 [Puia sp.]|nr:hypothetical protein [Puia sp.]
MKNSLKRTTACLIVLAFFQFAEAQNLQTIIKTQAMEMAKSLIKNDFVSFIKYLPPKIIEYAGGQQKLKSTMDSTHQAMKQFGVSFKKIMIGNPGAIISYKKQLQCVVPQSTDLQSLLGEMHIETSLVAISADNGRNWFFVDTNVYRADRLKSLLPDLSPRLVIPLQQEPKFTPNKE